MSGSLPLNKWVSTVVSLDALEAHSALGQRGKARRSDINYSSQLWHLLLV